MVRSIVLLVLVVACGKGKGAEGEDGGGGSEAPIPDVTGQYNVQAAAATGCAGESYWLEDWVVGPMVIAGSGENLDFDFLDEGMQFGGHIDNTNSFTFDGFVENVEFVLELGVVSASLDVFNSGDFEQQDNDCWIMKGDFVIEVNDDGIEATNCEITGSVQAYQLSGLDCDGL
jgi:hypothetical protein